MPIRHELESHCSPNAFQSLHWIGKLGNSRTMKHTLLSWQQCVTSMGVGMELRHLRYFVAVAEAGSLTVAAERILHTSQPSLSRQIRDLEEEVGAQLLTRTARGIELTPAGRAFLDHARVVVSQVATVAACCGRGGPPREPF